MAKYNTFNYGEELYGDESDVILKQRVPWVFQSPFEDDIYEFAINPLDATLPSVRKTLTTNNTTAGNNIIFQGRDEVGSLTCSGTILYEPHFRKLEEWSSKQKQVQLTDDLGQKFWIYITSFSPSRTYIASHPWRHEFSLEASVLDWS